MKSTSLNSTNTLHVMTQPVVHVNKFSPGGNKTNLLEDRLYHRRSSAKVGSSSETKQHEGNFARPPTHVVKQDASIVKHKERLVKA
mgnify:CR=1 FL=1